MKSTKYLLFVFLCGLFGSCNNDHDIENLKTEAGKYQLSNVEAKEFIYSVSTFKIVADIRKV